MAEIKIHSITSLITNSSTTIFTYSENSEAKVRELFNILIKDFGFPYSFDQMFSTVLLLEENQYYYSYLFDNDDLEEDDDRNEIIKQFPDNFRDRGEAIKKLCNDVAIGILPKPDWFNNAENSTIDGYSTPGTTLYINAKDEKYKPLADKLFKVIYSTTSEICET